MASHQKSETIRCYNHTDTAQGISLQEKCARIFLRKDLQRQVKSRFFVIRRKTRLVILTSFNICSPNFIIEPKHLPQCRATPPSTFSACPLIMPEAGNARNATTLAISCGSSARCTLCEGRICSKIELLTRPPCSGR